MLRGRAPMMTMLSTKLKLASLLTLIRILYGTSSFRFRHSFLCLHLNIFMCILRPFLCGVHFLFAVIFPFASNSIQSFTLFLAFVLIDMQYSKVKWKELNCLHQISCVTGALLPLWRYISKLIVSDANFVASLKKSGFILFDNFIYACS